MTHCDGLDGARHRLHVTRSEGRCSSYPRWLTMIYLLTLCLTHCVTLFARNATSTLGLINHFIEVLL